MVGLLCASVAGELGEAPAFLAGEAVDDLEALAEGAEQVGIACGFVGVSHTVTLSPKLRRCVVPRNTRLGNGRKQRKNRPSQRFAY